MFRLLIFFPLILFSQDFFLLPDDADTLMKSYNSHIKSANKEVYIYTPYLNEYTLTRTLKRLAKQSIPVVIITQGPLEKENKASHLSLYQNISVFTLHSLSTPGIQGSFICIDNEKSYTITQSLEHEKLSGIYAFAVYTKSECSSFFKTLLQRSSPTEKQ